MVMEALVEVKAVAHLASIIELCTPPGGSSSTIKTEVTPEPELAAQQRNSGMSWGSF